MIYHSPHALLNIRRLRVGKILFLIPRPDDKSTVERIFAENNNGEWELEVRHITGVRPITEYNPKNVSADVIIARGVTAGAVRQALPDIPVVDLMVSSYDLMDSVIECRTQFHADTIAVIGAPTMVYGAVKIEKYINVKIVPVVVDSEEDAERKILELSNRGITAMIGGGMSVEIGRKLGMNAVMMFSGEEAVFNALHEAKRVVMVRRYEQERNEQLRAIMDYSTQGIVAVDESGRVNLVNKTAIDLIGVGPNIIGEPADAIIPQLGLTSVLKTKEVERGWFKNGKGQQMAINRVPIKAHNQVIGSVSTFQPVAIIQELEREIRRRIYSKGLVAKCSFADIVSQSDEMRAVIAKAQEYSVVDSSVLIFGETGTGKELFAQSIHNASQRCKGVFVPVNCAALPENLLESELFGYVEGAFTGAIRGGKMGLFEQAHNGTIFLDEISEISLKIQGELLRVLQEREVRRVGDDKVIPIDVRIIAASNQDLRKLMSEGRFRQDLYYRLDILRLSLPPLRERTDDIIPLITFFIKNHSERYRRKFECISSSATELLKGYSWPGNVRELSNAAERLAVLNLFSEGVVGEEHIRSVLSDNTVRNPEVQEKNRATVREKIADQRLTSELERIRNTLIETNFNFSETAKKLGISRTTLWRRLRIME
jgi:transcriptional regulator, propionate catabolism operon regulatory protein